MRGWRGFFGKAPAAAAAAAAEPLGDAAVDDLNLSRCAIGSENYRHEMHTYVYIYIYICAHTHTHIYIYMYT